METSIETLKAPTAHLVSKSHLFLSEERVGDAGPVQAISQDAHGIVAVQVFTDPLVQHGKVGQSRGTQQERVCRVALGTQG